MGDRDLPVLRMHWTAIPTTSESDACMVALTNWGCQRDGRQALRFGSCSRRLVVGNDRHCSGGGDGDQFAWANPLQHGGA